MESPAGRQMHIFAKVNGKYYVYGGMTLPENSVLSDLWILNCDNVVWNSKLAEVPGAIWTQKQCTGINPGPLRGHTVATYDKYMILFGGEDGECKTNNNLYFFDTGTVFVISSIDSMTWSIPDTAGKAPEGRAFHQMNILANTYLTISCGLQGGLTNETKIYQDFYLLNLNTMEWVEAKIAGTLPSPRYGHSLALSTEFQAIIFGGVQNGHSLTNNDIFLIKENPDQEIQPQKDFDTANNINEPKLEFDNERLEVDVEDSKDGPDDFDYNKFNQLKDDPIEENLDERIIKEPYKTNEVQKDLNEKVDNKMHMNPSEIKKDPKETGMTLASEEEVQKYLKRLRNDQNTVLKQLLLAPLNPLN